MKIIRTRNTRYRHSARVKPLSRGKPSETLPIVDSNEIIQDPFDLDKDLLQSLSHLLIQVVELCQSLQVSASQTKLLSRISAPPTTEFWACSYFRNFGPCNLPINPKKLRTCEREMPKNFNLVFLSFYLPSPWLHSLFHVLELQIELVNEMIPNRSSSTSIYTASVGSNSPNLGQLHQYRADLVRRWQMTFFTQK